MRLKIVLLHFSFFFRKNSNQRYGNQGRFLTLYLFDEVDWDASHHFWNTYSWKKVSHLISLDHLIINHICTSLPKFSVKFSPCLCSMSHSHIHHSGQGDWAAVWVRNDHTDSSHKDKDTQKSEKNALSGDARSYICLGFIGNSFVFLSSPVNVQLCKPKLNTINTHAYS